MPQRIHTVAGKQGVFKKYSTYVLLLSLLLATSANQAFFSHLMELYSWSQDTGFMVSVTVLLVTVQAFFFSLLNLLLPARLLAVFLLLVAAGCTYFANKFGAIIDADMVRNLVETDIAEASDLISTGLMLHMLGFAVMPAVVMLVLPYRPQSWLQERWQAGKTGCVSVVLIVLAIMPFSDQYASFFRQHKSIRYWINPVYPLYSIFEYGKNSLPKTQRILESSGSYASIAADNNVRKVVVMVVGETARADHFSLNGYQRETNPRLSQLGDIISFRSIYSCGTSTAISVPCMFSFMGREGFDVNESRWHENVLDVVKKAGVNVVWLDNNSGSKRVADRVEFHDYSSADKNPVCDPECRDLGMLSGVKDYIESHDGDILIVLHQMGSHGPAYYKRYPEAFEQFKPACHTQELQECSEQEIINAYDNTILYTDYFLSQTINLLKQYESRLDTTMIYVSDHGESLGENGIYLHGMPYLFAPDVQKNVPLIIWSGKHSGIDQGKTIAISKKPGSHDSLTGTILDLFNVKTDAIRKAYPPLIVFLDD